MDNSAATLSLSLEVCVVSLCSRLLSGSILQPGSYVVNHHSHGSIWMSGDFIHMTVIGMIFCVPESIIYM